MTFIQTKTKILFAIAALALGLNLYTPSGLESELQEKSEIVALTKDQMSRIELTKAGEKVVLEQREGVWYVVSPYEDKADQARVVSMILSFRKGIKMDVLVDEKETDAYGTDASNGVVVEIWSSGSEPDISFTVGFDAAAGSSFVRLSNDPNIYRARVGGRHRYEHSVGDWRNQVLLDFELADVEQFELIDSSETKFQLSALSEGWQLTPTPAWDLDIEVIELMMQSLGRMRIGVRTDETIEEPEYKINVSLKSGKRSELWVGPQDKQKALVQLSGSETAVQVAARPVRLATQPLLNYRNKQIFSYVTRQDFDTVQFSHAGTDILLQQDLALGMWQVNRPNNIDIDLKSIFFMVNTLASLRGLAIAENITEPPPVSGHIIIGLLGGEQVDLWLYDKQENGAVLVRKGDDASYFWITKDDSDKLFQGFGLTSLNE